MKGPREKKTNEEDGYIYMTIKKEEKVWKSSEITEKTYSGSNNNAYIYCVCYRDKEDKNTIEHTLFIDWNNTKFKK